VLQFVLCAVLKVPCRCADVPSFYVGAMMRTFFFATFDVLTAVLLEICLVGCGDINSFALLTS
jgi:hypothetical protein